MQFAYYEIVNRESKHESHVFDLLAFRSKHLLVTGTDIKTFRPKFRGIQIICELKISYIIPALRLFQCI